MSAQLLTVRELAVLTAMAHGHSQRDTAAQQRISRNLVRTCIGTVLAKLGATNLPHAVAIAIRDQFIQASDVPGGPT